MTQWDDPFPPGSTPRSDDDEWGRANNQEGDGGAAGGAAGGAEAQEEAQWAIEDMEERQREAAAAEAVGEAFKSQEGRRLEMGMGGGGSALSGAMKLFRSVESEHVESEQPEQRAARRPGAIVARRPSSIATTTRRPSMIGMEGAVAVPKSDSNSLAVFGIGHETDDASIDPDQPTGTGGVVQGVPEGKVRMAKAWRTGWWWWWG